MGRRLSEFDEERALPSTDDASGIDVSEVIELEDIRDAKTRTQLQSGASVSDVYDAARPRWQPG